MTDAPTVSEIQRLRDAIEQIVPDAAIRDLALLLIADSIAVADEGVSRSWALAVIPTGGLRLHLANRKVAEIGRRDVFYMLVDNSNPSADFQTLIKRLEQPNAQAFRDTPNVSRLFIPWEELATVLPQIRVDYDKLLKRIRDHKSGRPDEHSPIAQQYLAQETGRTLPIPSHAQPAPQASSAVQAAMERAYPDPEVRRKVMNLLADSIELADQGVEGCWSLTLLSRQSIRLTVGSTAAFRAGWHGAHELPKLDSADFTSRPVEPHFSMTISTAPAALSEESIGLAERFKSFQFRSPSDAISVGIPVGQMDELLPHLLPAHQAAIEQLRNWRSGTGDSFSAEAFDYIERETGRDLPVSPHMRSGKDSPTHDQIQAAMERAYPELHHRSAVMNVLADSIVLAHKANPRSWSLSFPGGDLIRLSVGSMETVVPGGYRSVNEPKLLMVIDKKVLAPDLLSQIQLLFVENPNNKSYPSAERILIPISQLDETLPRIRESHNHLIEGLSGRNTIWARSHSQAALQYVRDVTGRKDLPDPAYATELRPTAPRTRAWKLSIGDKSLNLKIMLDQQVMALEFDSIAFDVNETNPTREHFRQALEDKGVAWDPAPNHGPLQLQKLLYDVKAGDRVYIYYDKAVRASGVVNGDYHYDASSAGLRHRRDAALSVERIVPLNEMSQPLATKLEKSFMALESLTPEQADELDRLIAGEKVIVREKADWRSAYRKLFANEGLHYTPWQQAVFFTALQTKGFVILSGISGTGKTKIAQAFSAALPQPEDGRNVEFLTVRPDWRDSKSLLGYHNPITDRYEWTPFLHFLLRARESWEAEDGLAWFVILDEMNLAHVEHYFAELLSVLESGRDEHGWTREAIHLPSSGAEGSPPASLKLPPNLHIIGTVNLDETTHAFSPKVLDRAFAMELSDVSFTGFPFATATGDLLTDGERDALLNAFSVGGAFPRIDQAAISARLAVDGRPRDWLEALNRQLRPHHMHFGYRVFAEIMAFVDLGMNNDLFSGFSGGAGALVTTFDAAVLMKVLPKFHGSRARLEGPLTKVLGWCLNPAYPETQTVETAINQAASPDALEAKLLELHYAFPETAQRAIRLLWSAKVEGFAAFG